MSSTALSLLPKGPQTDLLIALAKDEGIPPSGITILGGKPYVNTTGLDVKLQSKCNEEKLVHVGTEYVQIQSATKENGMRAGGWGIVKLFDKMGFEKALGMAAKGGPVSADVIQTLKELYFRIYKMRGFASPETLSMQTMKNVDNIEAMAERRATNRAKREATGTGLTSVDEMDENGEAGLPDEPIDAQAREITKQREAQDAPTGGAFQTDGPELGAAYISKDQTAALKRIMEEFSLTPEQFKAIIEKQIGRAPKGTADVRKPEYAGIVKLFEGVRVGAYNLRDGKIEKPDDDIPF